MDEIPESSVALTVKVRLAPLTTLGGEFMLVGQVMMGGIASYTYTLECTRRRLVTLSVATQVVVVYVLPAVPLGPTKGKSGASPPGVHTSDLHTRGV